MFGKHQSPLVHGRTSHHVPPLSSVCKHGGQMISAPQGNGNRKRCAALGIIQDCLTLLVIKNIIFIKWLKRTGHFENRHIHGNDECSDYHPQENQHEGFDQRRQVVYRLVNFFFVKIGNLLKHGV